MVLKQGHIDVYTICRAQDPRGWLQFQKTKWRVAAATRAKQKQFAERARKRGRAHDETAAGLAPRGILYTQHLSQLWKWMLMAKIFRNT